MAQKTVFIEHAAIVLAEGYITDGELLIEDGLIAAFGPAGSVEVPADAVRYDAQGAYVGPGLIDIHIHASGNRFFYADPVYAADYALKHGATSVLPTLYYDLDLEGYLESIDKIRGVMDDGSAPNIRGFYMEGPYTNPKYGACADGNKWAKTIDRDMYMPIVERTGDRALVWALAPEREGIEGFIDDVLAVNPNALLAVAHSEASAEQVEALIPKGLLIATHHTNAIGILRDNGGCHRASVLDAVHANDCMYAELIVDSQGSHVAPYLLRLIRDKYKSRDRIILISDATAFPGSSSEDNSSEDLCFDNQGLIAGSKLTLDIACRNMIRHTGCSVCDAFFYASTNPARLLGWTDRGEIAVGKVADLVCVDDSFGVKQVILGGELL